MFKQQGVWDIDLNRPQSMSINRHNIKLPAALAKKLAWLVCVSFLGIMAGCGRSEKLPASDPNAGLPPEAIAVRRAFASADPSYRNPVESALDLVRAGQKNPTALAEVLPLLERLVANQTITADQKQALTGLIDSIKARGIKSAPMKDVR